MIQTEKSVLVISSDPALAGTISATLSALPGLSVKTEANSLAAMNGQAVKAAGHFDVILFQSQPGDTGEAEAVRQVSAARRHGAVLMALADGAMTLAQVRALSEAGVDEVLPFSGAASELGSKLAGLGRPIAGGARAGRVIAVMPARGGVGASTLSVNLADRLANEERRFRKTVRRPVALLDLDLQFGSAGAMLDLAESDAMLSLTASGAVPSATAVAQSLSRAANGVSVLPAPPKFAPLDSLNAEQVSRILDALRGAHDHVVVDLPHALVGWIEPVLARADRLLLVTDLSVPAIRQCRRLIDFVNAENSALPIDIVVARDARPVFGSAVRREAERALDRQVLHWLPDDPKSARVAADRGQPLAVGARGRRLSRSIEGLARGLAEALSATARAPK
ncbi:MAG: CpaE family protein [Paracoccaceae bacterium]